MKRLKNIYQQQKTFLLIAITTALIGTYTYTKLLEAPLTISALVMTSLLAAWLLIPQWWIRTITAGIIIPLYTVQQINELSTAVGIIGLVMAFITLFLAGIIGVIISIDPLPNKRRWYHLPLGLIITPLATYSTMQVLVFLLLALN